MAHPGRLALSVGLAILASGGLALGERLPLPRPAVVLQEVPGALERYARGDFDAAVTHLLDGQKITALNRPFRRQAEAWIAGGPPAERPARLAVAAAMAVEMMAASFARDIVEYETSRELIEWACGKLRQQQTPSSFERWFHLAAMALMQGAGDDSLLSGRRAGDLMLTVPGGDSHVRHAGLRFPGESRFHLAYLTTRRETQQLAAWPLPPAYLVKADLGRFSSERPGDTEELDLTLSELAKLFGDAAVGAEARLRSGVLRFLRGQHTAAAADLGAATVSSDPSILYVASLVLGMIAEQKNEPGEALTWYRRAHRAVPASASSVVLAGLLYRTGRADEASVVLEAFAHVAPPPDPWRLYGQRDFRFFDGYRERMRQAVRP